MNDPDGMVQTIREQEKEIDNLRARLVLTDHLMDKARKEMSVLGLRADLRSQRINIWKGLATLLFDELADLTKDADPSDSQRRFLEATRYESE